MKKNMNKGSSFEDFLKEEGVLDEIEKLVVPTHSLSKEYEAALNKWAEDFNNGVVEARETFMESNYL